MTRGKGQVANVIFDLGGVVLEWNPDRILAGYYPDAASRSLLRAGLFGHSDWGEFDSGGLDEAQLVSRASSRCARPKVEIRGLLQATRDSLELKRDTLALIERLAAQGIPLYCLSNMPKQFWAHLLVRYTFWPVFRGIVISGEIGVKKPHPQCFDYLLTRYGLEPNKTAFVDDMPANIQAAKSLGMQAILFEGAQSCAIQVNRLLRKPTFHADGSPLRHDVSTQA